jgi:TetR/AcrR family transcriptional regulator
MNATPSTAPAAAHGGETVERILQMAESLFAEQGFDAVSMSAIAEAAGVSKANVFHHFSSKNALYLTVVRRACQDAHRHLDDLGAEGSPLPARLAQFTHAHLLNVLEHAPVTRLLLRELLSDNPRLGREIAEQVYGEKFARFVAILKAGQQGGALRADVDAAMVATVLVGANVFFFQARDVLRHFPDVGFTDDPQQFSTLLTDILLRGILPSAAAGQVAPAETTTTRNRP